MKPGYSILSILRDFIERLISRYQKPNVETLYPKCHEDVKTILTQAGENGTPVSVVGGTYPTCPLNRDIHMCVCYMDRLLGLDILNQTVMTGPGMKLSHLTRLLETVNLTLDIQGTLPDLAVVDAISIGAFGSTSYLPDTVLQVQVVTADAETVTWTWDSHQKQMAALLSGLGMVAVVIAVTFKCIPLYRVTEISYLTSIRDILETWGVVYRTSQAQQISWYPFTELVILTHTNAMDKNTWSCKQSWVNQKLGSCSQWVARTARKINIFLSSSLPLFSSLLARVQLFSMWSVARYRSDHAHSPQNYHSHCDNYRGTSWLLPIDCLPPLLYNISAWSKTHSRVVASPLYIQTVRNDRVPVHTSYLSPSLSSPDAPSASVWYDWFLPETCPDPLEVAEFEEMFHSVQGVRCWSSERIVSPLVLSNTFPKYKEWCKVKSEIDPDQLFSSGYVQGNVWSPPPPGLSLSKERSLSRSSLSKERASSRMSAPT